MDIQYRLHWDRLFWDRMAKRIAEQCGEACEHWVDEKKLFDNLDGHERVDYVKQLYFPHMIFNVKSKAFKITCCSCMDKNLTCHKNFPRTEYLLSRTFIENS